MSREFTPRICLLLVLAASAGCSSSQFRRIDADRELYESWPIEMRQAVLDGKVEAGMTPEMVKMALGKPSEIVSRSTVPGEDEIWIYRTGGFEDTSGMMGYPGGPSYPGGSYPGAGYPGSTYPGGGMGYPGGGVVTSTPGIGISTGRGGTVIGPTGPIGIGTSVGPVGIGIGSGGGGGMGMPMPAPLPSTPPTEREVVFRNGVVHRADPAP
ncbi:MAG TPA: hypothetical protein VHO24_11210 [Opitutaceae bacterium]|nr:hypothetical protein [Opitutaceae bacterium]